MYRCSYSVIFFIFISLSYSEYISIEKAEIIAQNIFSTEYANSKTKELSAININDGENTVIYAFNNANNGFVLVSADDRVMPVLGYSFNNVYSNDNLPIQLEDMILYYKKQIMFAINNNTIPDNHTKSLWDYYLSGNLNNNRNVSPLMNTNWDQGHPWNDQCPQDNQGPGGNVYAGCVATAAAMVMKYWNHPEYGEGNHSYNHSDYGLINVDFNTFYNWNSMSNNSSSDPTRKILYHVGVSCEMNYGPYGSGAWVGEYEPSLTTALKDYFKYNEETTFLSKDNYDDVFWLEAVKTELDEGRPLIYKGYTQDLSAGHAFVVDGYDEDLFHLNWGWSGSYNGWFAISNLSPGGYNFSTWQGAVFNLYPEVEQVFGCTDINACNYDENANTNNDSCEYNIDCLGECGGDAIIDECGECDGNGSLCVGNAILSFGDIDESNLSFEILFESDTDIAGFQFTINDVPENIVLESFSGGLSEYYNFTVSCSEEGVVIGFSFNGDVIPSGSGLLTTANYAINGIDPYTLICFEEVIFSNPNGTAINVTTGECVALEVCTFSGDLNNDGIINVLDVIISINMILNPEDLVLCESDINQDQILNIQDIILLMNIVLNQ